MATKKAAPVEAPTKKKTVKTAAPEATVKKAAPAAGKKVTTKTGATATETPEGTFVFDAPSDFKGAFYMMELKTEKDGLLGGTVKATRYVGQYKEDAEEKKMFDLASYDLPTLLGVSSRLAGRTFKVNGKKIMPSNVEERNQTEKVRNAEGKVQKDAEGNVKMKYTYGSGYRLPANTTFLVLLRAGVSKAKGNILTVGVRQVEQLVVVKKNGVERTKRVLLDKKDPAYRMFVGARRFLPAAFLNAMLPPKRVRGQIVKPKGEDE